MAGTDRFDLKQIEINPGNHCIVGTWGWCVVPNIMAALNYWAEKRKREITWIFKGQNRKTEMFSAFQAAVVRTEDPRTHFNKSLVDFLGEHNCVYVCGQARSHCVNLSTRDLFKGLKQNESKNTEIVMIWDGSSPVTDSEGIIAGSDNDFKQFLHNENIKCITSDAVGDLLSSYDVNSSKNIVDKQTVIAKQVAIL